MFTGIIERANKIALAVAFGLSLLLPMFLPIQKAFAAADTCTWTGATSTSWSDGSNWSGCDNGGVPENDDTLIFPGSTSNQSMNNDIVGLTPDSISITGAGYTFNGNALTVIVSGNFFDTTQDATINLQVAFNGANTGGRVSSGKTLTFAQPVAFGSSSGQYWDGGGTAIFNGNMTGSTGGMFRAENSTTVEVHGAANTFTSSFVGAEVNGTLIVTA